MNRNGVIFGGVCMLIGAFCLGWTAKSVTIPVLDKQSYDWGCTGGMLVMLNSNPEYHKEDLPNTCEESYKEMLNVGKAK